MGKGQSGLWQSLARAAGCRRPAPGILRPGNYAVTACFWSLLVT